ncbi:MAG: hypothetical protein JJE02_10970 [Propionibacteriales bacterium]|nr:hypothetical protein [Propionibacteriales bacterium]
MQTPARVALVLVGMLGAFVLAAGPAAADAPTTWQDPEPMSKLDVLVLFGGSTLGLIVLLTLLGLFTGRKNYTPPAPSTDVEKVPSH